MFFYLYAYDKFTNETQSNGSKKNKKGTVVNSYIFEGIFYFLYDSFVSIIFIPL